MPTRLKGGFLAGEKEVSAEDDIYEQYKKRMMLGYRYRPNPLVNNDVYNVFFLNHVGVSMAFMVS